MKRTNAITLLLEELELSFNAGSIKLTVEEICTAMNLTSTATDERNNSTVGKRWFLRGCSKDCKSSIASIFCRQSAATCSRWFLARGLFYLEDEGDTFLRNVGSNKIYTVPNPRRRHFLKNWNPKNTKGYLHTNFMELFLISYSSYSILVPDIFVVSRKHSTYRHGTLFFPAACIYTILVCAYSGHSLPVAVIKECRF
jgi:hypothetical protein